MYGLFDCRGVMIGKYKTHRGLMIAVGKRKRDLYYLADTTPIPQKVEPNLVWYSEWLEIKV